MSQGLAKLTDSVGAIVGLMLGEHRSGDDAYLCKKLMHVELTGGPLRDTCCFPVWIYYIKLCPWGGASIYGSMGSKGSRSPKRRKGPKAQGLFVSY